MEAAKLRSVSDSMSMGNDYRPSAGVGAEVNGIPKGNTDTVYCTYANNSGKKIAFPSGTRVGNVDAPGDGGKEDRD